MTPKPTHSKHFGRNIDDKAGEGDHADLAELCYQQGNGHDGFRLPENSEWLRQRPDKMKALGAPLTLSREQGG